MATTKSRESVAELERKYKRMFVILALLPMLSVAAYLTGIRPLAIFTAIGVILFSTYFATTTFMHIDVEPRFVPYLVLLCFAFSLLYLFLTAPDVMMHSGQQWVKVEAGGSGEHSSHGGAPAAQSGGQEAGQEAGHSGGGPGEQVEFGGH